MANFFDAVYDDPRDPKYIIVWEQDYETHKIRKLKYPIEDYLYFYSETTEDQSEMLSMTGKHVKKINLSNYRIFKDKETYEELKRSGFDVFETDIEPLQKCLWDNYGTENKKQPKWNICLYDIETDYSPEYGFADPHEAKYETTAITAWFKNADKMFTLSVVPPRIRNIWDKYDSPEIINGSLTYYFESEKEMYEHFFELLTEYETVACGAWNGDGYDLPYIYNRVVKLFGKDAVGDLMGDFPKVNNVKTNRGDTKVVIHRPIGRIWFDSMEVYKKQAGEKVSYALNAIAEEELDAGKLEFEGSFEDVYHGERKLRAIFDEETGFQRIIPGFHGKRKVQKYVDFESLSDESMDVISPSLEQMFETYQLFLEYSVQDVQLLKDMEIKLKYFDVMMMLAQMNVTLFQNTFATLVQVESGIANFAHNMRKMVVIDRSYDIAKQPYNKYVDKDVLRLRKGDEGDNNTENVSDDVVKNLEKNGIAGAHVLLCNIGLISYNREKLESLNAKKADLVGRLKALGYEA